MTSLTLPFNEEATIRASQKTHFDENAPQWESISLSQICEINPSSQRPRNMNRDTLVSFVPMAAVSETYGIIVCEEERPLSSVVSGYTSFDRNDILVAKITPCFENGKIAVANISHAHGFGSTEFHVLRPDPELLNRRYALHFLRQKSVRAEGEKNMIGSAGQKRVPAYFLKTLKVLLPPLPEQRRIVEILDEADAAVRLTEALIAAKLRHKRAWAQRLLTGQVRFPEFAGEAWQEATLGQFFRDRNARYTGDGPPTVLSCSKIYGIVPQTDLFSRVLASKDLRRYKLVEPGDLVFDPMLLWDASINFSARRGVVSPAYSTLQFVADEAEPRFFHYLFDSHTLRHIYKTISQGTNTRRKKATANDFLKIAVRMPRPPEQRKIAEVLGLMDEEIVLRRRQLAALKAQKQGLMQKLLTGEVRVKETAP